MDELKKKIDEEFARVSSMEKADNPMIDGCIYDGIIDEMAYRSSPYRCCFILKEPFDDFDGDEPIGGDWKFSDIYEKWDVEAPVRRASTISRASAIVYSINHYFCETDDLTSQQLREGFQSICWINLSKTPANNASPLSRTLSQRVKIWSQMVHYQLLLAKADIHIFGNTWDWYFLDYPYQTIPQSKRSYPQGSKIPSLSMYKTVEGVIEVDAYHPGRKSIAYETMMINGLKDILQSD